MINMEESEIIDDYKELMIEYEDALQQASNLHETEYWLGKVNQLAEMGFMSHIQRGIWYNEYVDFTGN